MNLLDDTFNGKWHRAEELLAGIQKMGHFKEVRCATTVELMIAWLPEG